MVANRPARFVTVATLAASQQPCPICQVSKMPERNLPKGELNPLVRKALRSAVQAVSSQAGDWIASRLHGFGTQWPFGSEPGGMRG